MAAEYCRDAPVQRHTNRARARARASLSLSLSHSHTHTHTHLGARTRAYVRAATTTRYLLRALDHYSASLPPDRRTCDDTLHVTVFDVDATWDSSRCKIKAGVGPGFKSMGRRVFNRTWVGYDAS